jgi:catechol 2,3-dioxygenase-like lactoylglutathione lyase family enzyme
MSLFSWPKGANYVPVVDLAGATAWYVDKLGLRKIDVEMDDSAGCVALGFSKDDFAVCLGPKGSPADETPMLTSTNLKKAHALLVSRGVKVTEIQQDRQGTHYFEMRDLEGNIIEVFEDH